MTEPQEPEPQPEPPLTHEDLTDDDFKGEDLHPPAPGDDPVDVPADGGQ